MMSLQSDCPARERLGYGGDALMTYESIALNFDASLFHEKRMRDYVDAQRPDGGYTETAPYVGMSDAGMSPNGGPIGWQSFLTAALAWGLRYHANDLAARELYPSASAFIELLRATPASAIEHGLGDWMTLEDSALGLTGWGFARECFAAFAAVAAAQGDAAAAAAAARDAANATARMNAQYLDPATPGLYRCAPASGCTSNAFNDTQCGQALPLYLGIVPPAQRAAAIALLADNLARRDGHLSVGSFGVKYLLLALADAGRADLAYGILAQTTFPSFGYMLAQNATTMWESWSYSASTFSHAHPMFGSSTTYIVQSLAGIRLAPDARGADKLLLAPQPPPRAAGLDWANVTWSTVHGDVVSAWRYTGDAALALHFELPPNARAVLTLPLSGKVLEVGSGAHDFTDAATQF